MEILHDVLAVYWLFTGCLLVVYGSLMMIDGCCVNLLTAAHSTTSTKTRGKKIIDCDIKEEEK